MIIKTSNMGAHADIFLYGEIGANDLTWKQFETELKPAENANTINIKINCIGGDYDQARKMYLALYTNNARKTVDIEGDCYSMATILALTGHTVNMAADAYIFVHEVSGSVRTRNAEGTNFLVNTCAERTGMDHEELRDALRNGTYFNARDAYIHGWIDQVSAPTGLAAKATLSQLEHSPAGRYINSGMNGQRNRQNRMRDVRMRQNLRTVRKIRAARRHQQLQQEA